MAYYPEPVARLIEALQRLPGIGPKTAQRLTFFLLKRPVEEVRELSESLVAVKDRRNAAKNPYAHLQMPELTIEEVLESPMLWDPIRYLETCPSSDGACALVFASADQAKKGPRRPAWIRETPGSTTTSA